MRAIPTPSGQSIFSNSSLPPKAGAFGCPDELVGWESGPGGGRRGSESQVREDAADAEERLSRRERRQLAQRRDGTEKTGDH